MSAPSPVLNNGSLVLEKRLSFVPSVSSTKNLHENNNKQINCLLSNKKFVANKPSTAHSTKMHSKNPSTASISLLKSKQKPDNESTVISQSKSKQIDSKTRPVSPVPNVAKQIPSPKLAPSPVLAKPGTCNKESKKPDMRKTTVQIKKDTKNEDSKTQVLKSNDKKTKYVLYNKMKKLPNFAPLSMSSIPGYSLSKGTLKAEQIQLQLSRKPNKLELAKNSLISYIQDYKKQNKEHPKTNLDFYMVGRVLGKGAFGKVNLCLHKLSGKLVAIKSLQRKYIEENKNNNAKLKNEISILRLLKHPNIMRLYETFNTNDYVLIVMELCSGGDLLSYVRKRRRVDEQVAKLIFKEILDGLAHCHSKGIIHRDIKLDNILLNEQGHVKIGDFGVSKKIVKGRKLIDRCGTPAYIAPEILQGKGYEGEKADIWSAGIVLYAMIYGNFPFKGNTVEDLEKAILSGNFEMPNDTSPEARDLISKLVVLDPNIRPGINEILQHQWMCDTCINTAIFTEEEIDSIRNEYRFNALANENLDESQSSIFTEHKLDTTEIDPENDPDLSKSAILAPFNTVENNPAEFLKQIEDKYLPKKTIKLHSKLREFDRRYERNNNSQLDNGVYVQPVGGASPKGFQNIKNKPSMSTSAPSTPGYKSPKMPDTPFNKSKNPGEIRRIGIASAQSFYSAVSECNSISQNNGVDKEILEKMEKMGFDKGFTISSLNANELNSATTLFYLLSNT